MALHDLNSPPFSPLGDTGFSSPEGSDTLQTPLHDHAERHIFSPHVPFDYTLVSPNGNSHSIDSPNPRSIHDPHAPTILSPLSKFGHTSLPAIERQKRIHRDTTDALPPMFPPRMRDLSNTPLEVDPFAASFRVAAKFGDELYDRTQAGSHFPHAPSLLLQTSEVVTSQPPSLSRTLSGYYSLNRNARFYSERFPENHLLDKRFVNEYQLGDELGKGGYGFVMTAHHRAEGREVAVKFIIKAKVPEHAWMEAEGLGRPLPAEVLILNFIEHENIVKCLDLFEDSKFFYMVQELHGTPWRKVRSPKEDIKPSPLAISTSIPSLTPSASGDSIPDSDPDSPYELSTPLDAYHDPARVQVLGSHHPGSSQDGHAITPMKFPVQKRHGELLATARPACTRRPSHDLFECIEQSQNKRLTEDDARYIFAQVVEAVFYLDALGITHRDIKDENLVIDKDHKVKLIDFGSAIIANPADARPFHTLFFGTTAYASSEILTKKPYQAPPAEIWTLGILLSYLLTGASPFPTERDAIAGRITLNDNPSHRLSRACLDLMSRCLEPDPARRADIKEVRAHRWLSGALDGRGGGK